ncbi:hypothetical protein [Amycolatopsis sp. EV170708-02-1]|uniref:hypothetical protein n=1 Tax=Amycolatopsis sp. EV170708-02-1 TaxID=2919322 RepID=UPI001F0B9661|nr:hypothetical protein [Amycolatopsis sp. EV170708-02-1]UMP06685.1 hypothetical protein MJQ72_18575 [Amycolatopsis sp. EV170708-02-1]
MDEKCPWCDDVFFRFGELPGASVSEPETIVCGDCLGYERIALKAGISQPGKAVVQDLRSQVAVGLGVTPEQPGDGVAGLSMEENETLEREKAKFRRWMAKCAAWHVEARDSAEGATLAERADDAVRRLRTLQFEAGAIGVAPCGPIRCEHDSCQADWIDDAAGFYQEFLHMNEASTTPTTTLT